MRKTSKPAFESIEFVFGTTGHGYRLLTYGDGQTIIESHSWRNWGDVAKTARRAWDDFAENHAEELQAWSDECHRAIRASTPIDPADRGNILEQFIGSPEATSAQALLEEIGSSSRAFERLSQLTTASSAPGTAFGTAMTDDAAIAGFQRVLDEEGFGYIRLVRDDDFIRKVYSPSERATSPPPASASGSAASPSAASADSRCPPSPWP
jgi:hypothetical protein